MGNDFSSERPRNGTSLLSQGRPTAHEQTTDFGNQGIRVAWFDDNGVETGLPGLVELDRMGIAGRRNQRDVPRGVFRPQLARDVKPRHVGELQVHHDHIRKRGVALSRASWPLAAVITLKPSAERYSSQTSSASR